MVYWQADGFYFNVIPFADDMREFQFKSFSSAPESLQPSVEQQAAADNLVRMLDLSPDDDEELLQPEQTVNPILQVRVIVPKVFVLVQMLVHPLKHHLQLG